MSLCSKSQRPCKKQQRGLQAPRADLASVHHTLVTHTCPTATPPSRFPGSTQQLSSCSQQEHEQSLQDPCPAYNNQLPPKKTSCFFLQAALTTFVHVSATGNGVFSMWFHCQNSSAQHTRCGEMQSITSECSPTCTPSHLLTTTIQLSLPRYLCLSSPNSACSFASCFFSLFLLFHGPHAASAESMAASEAGTDSMGVCAQNATQLACGTGPPSDIFDPQAFLIDLLTAETSIPDSPCVLCQSKANSLGEANGAAPGTSLDQDMT